MKEWEMWSLRMPPELHDALRSTARQSDRTMSDIVRQGTWLEIEAADKCSSEVLEAAEIALRERKERLKIMKPKTRHRAMMLPIQAWNSILTERREYERLDLMCSGMFDSWITLLEENKQSIDDDNPEYVLVCERMDALIQKLREERNKLYPEGI